ncbi:Hypothetical protein, putative [Bodo saltans]|uniref:Uncharacterized protein n=1 Tax=Bodo saltans TaxID=75058 RepID=A0A0S4JCF1_BODSA|nr:Hypothetical protein, putative [Bodo saltans]|eukprot:CUG87682.1 Hypothetical protein, putative [Bodo saltans]
MIRYVALTINATKAAKVQQLLSGSPQVQLISMPAQAVQVMETVAIAISLYPSEDLHRWSRAAMGIDDDDQQPKEELALFVPPSQSAFLQSLLPIDGTP